MATTPDPRQRPLDPAASPLRLSRRAVLSGLGGLGGAVLLGACAPTNTTTDAGRAGTTGAASPPTLNLVPRFDPNGFAAATVAQRLVLSVVTNSNDVPANLPGSLDFVVTRRGDGGAEVPVGATLPTKAFQDGVPVPYFPVRFTPDQPGTYRIKTTVDGAEIATNFVVQAPGQLTGPTVGQRLTVTDSPTTTDPRGVTPICTRERDGKEAFCPHHTVNLRDALAAAKPLVLIVSTPAFCQIGVCGPVLELFTEQAAAHPTVQVIHAEVYADPASGSQQTAPLVDALGLTFEPALYAVGADGTIVDALTHVFDRQEIAAAFAALR